MQKDTENNKNTQGAQDVQATADAEIKKPAAAVDFSGIDFEKLVNAITSAKSVKEMLPEERAEYLAAVKSYQNRLHENAAVIERLIGHPAADPEYYLQFFVNGTLKDVQSVFVGILDFYESETWRFYAGAFPDFEEWFIGINPQYENILDVAITLEYCRQLEAAQPFAPEETEAYKKRTGAETVPFSAFMRNILSVCIKRADEKRKSELLNKKNLPMLHGKGTDALATMINQPTAENRYNRTKSITREQVTLVFREIETINGNIGMSAHKLLSTAIADFTAKNNTSTQGRDLRNLRVSIPLKEYAILCGYDVTEHATNTPEEAAKEKQRAENALKKARRKIKDDLDTLFNSYISWSESVRGKKEDFDDVRIIGRKGIRNGIINMEFSLTMGEYLIKLPITQYPVSLLKLDERNAAAYSIGLKMTEHFNMDNNQKRGTAQLLKVSTLLKVTNFPKIATIRKQRASWEQKIKEPFENALDALTRCGFLKDWEYSHSKGEPMNDNEAVFTSFEQWQNALIFFTLNDIPDNRQRLLNQSERIEKKSRKEANKKKSG